MLVFGFIYVWLFIPETKGLSLEEVDELYRAGVKPWKSAGWKPSLRATHDHPNSVKEDKTDKASE
jgi:MFS transporter, SP family, sugar:H+ symporter